ncbi:MAG: hypothetical protein ACOH1K_02085 [Rhodoglobus sp.]
MAANSPPIRTINDEGFHRNDVEREDARQLISIRWIPRNGAGTPNSYSIIPKGTTIDKGTLRVTVSEGVEAYSFTFG